MAKKKKTKTTNSSVAFYEFHTLNPSEWASEMKQKLDSVKQNQEYLLSQENYTYDTFVKPLEISNENLLTVFTPLSHLNSVMNSSETEKAYMECDSLLTEYFTSQSQDKRIYDVYKKIYQKERKQLNAEKVKVLENSLRDFKLSGAFLSKKKKQELMNINLRLSELSNTFSQNLIKATNEYELIISDKEAVKEIPGSDLKLAECKHEGKKAWKFTLQMPSYLSYMTYGTNREYRKELEKAYLSRSPENGKIIEEILRLRSEKVKILGFKNFAELSLSTKIASSPDEVLFFLTELGKKGKVFAKKELKELKDFAKKEGHQGSLESYDRMYYAEKLKKKKFNLDEDKYRPYFEKESVTRGLLEFCGKLFGIEFSKVEVKTWHPSVLVYDLKKENRVFSRLYLDLESRKDKRGGAWLHNWQTAHSKPDASIQLASAFIVANFPASSDKQPSLLRHSDVVTLFHEMGHALQHLCSNVGECSISGIGGVEWDAVEFPSQFLENFAYNPEVLQVFARHYKTKKVLPTAMIQNLVEAKNFLSGILLLRQLEFGIFDMKIHIEDSCSEKRVQDILNEVRKEVGVFKAAGYNKFQNGFSHIFGGGYAAGYYSYKWAELLSADAYFEFLKQGIYSDIAKKYYEIILQRGGSENAMTLFRKFIGREPDVDALLRLHGMS